MEYIIGFIATVMIIIYYIGMAVWQDTMTREFQKIIKTAEINIKEIHESDLLILKQTVFPDGNDNDIENIYIDGLFNIINCTMKESAQLIKRIANLTDRFGINVYINININGSEEVPEGIKEYVA